MKKIAIVIHLYYVDLWEEFAAKLAQLDIDYDLYITVPHDKLYIKNTICTNFTNANIIGVLNKGLDIGPFLLVIEHIINKKKQYSYIIKLHSKKSIHHGQPEEFGQVWRTELVNSLIGSSTNIKEIVEYLKSNTEYKLAGASKYIYEEKSTAWMQDLLDSLAINVDSINGPKYFIAGTMFIVDCAFLLNFFKQIEIKKLYDLMGEGYARDCRIEHKMERVLSFIVLEKGYKIYKI